ncbi:MAG: hypothetical protein EOO13_09585 [Chitinophagaceae bacterium]|nr:MAG: hypothetical protein EOO13_09585 [Chitinophagaceae bacterium]
MQRIFLIGVLITALSCNSGKEDKPADASENWVVAEKNRYDYKLNSIGRPDTTFVYTHKYKDGLIVDSSVAFTVNKYNGDFLSDELAFVVGKDQKIIPQTVTKYTFNKNGQSISRNISGAGKLIREERFSYNDSNLLVKSTIIQIRNRDKVTGGTLELSTASAANIGYDTVTTLYTYDAGKKLVETKMLNSRGEMLRKEVNLYSGNDPLLTAAINQKGDTLKRITYEKRDKVLMTVSETDSVVLFQNYLNGVQIAQKTKYKNRNEQWRSAVRFDEKGRKAEETLYKAL